MRRLRVWIFAALLGLLFVQIWLGFPIKLEDRDADNQATIEELPAGAQQKMKGVHLVESAKGDRDWELFADQAEGFEGKGKWLLKSVRILFYSENKIQFTVTGKEAEIDGQTKNMKIEGKVKTVTQNGYTYESPLLLYIAKQRLLQSPGPIRMSAPPDAQGPGMVVTASYLRGMVAQSEISLEGNVIAQKKLLKNHNFLLRAGKAFFSGRHHLAEFKEQVIIEYDAIKLESPQASFQYKSGSSLLDSIQLKGGVKLNDLNKYATADLVRIEPETNQIVLNGSPRVVQDQDELLGEQIVFVDGGKKVRIEKMRARVEKPPGEQ